MSTDWHVHCVTCNETHYFSDANHQDTLMAALCRNAAAIAGLASMLDDMLAHGVALCDLEFSLRGRGQIDPRWFAAHLGHKLVPIDEYGGLMTQCAEYVRCVCGSTRRCTKDHDHDGDHDPEARR